MSQAVADRRREVRRQKKKWLQEKAIRSAAECMLEHANDDDDAACDAAWDAVKEIEGLDSLDLDDDEEEPPPRRRGRT